MEYKIEKGVPMSNRRKYPLLEMEIGDSFHIPGIKTTKYPSGAIGYARIKLGYKFVSRKERDGIRIWRIA